MIVKRLETTNLYYLDPSPTGLPNSAYSLVLAQEQYLITRTPLQIDGIPDSSKRTTVAIAATWQAAVDFCENELKVHRDRWGAWRFGHDGFADQCNIVKHIEFDKEQWR